MDALVLGLLAAASAGRPELVRALLFEGVFVDSTSGEMDTALILSSLRGCIECVKLLAGHGANVNHRNTHGTTALLLAAANDHLPICLYLISLGANWVIPDTKGHTALLHYGVSKAPALTAEVIEGRVAQLRIAREQYLVGTKTAVLKHPVRSNATLLFSDAFSDLVFVCPDGERIHAHRCMVAASSPHMNALLQGPWAENAGQASEVKMLQSAAAVRALLRFMYTGEVDAEACTAHTMDVLDLASQHEQPDLKAACELIASESISVESVGSILEAAHLHEHKSLKAKCIKFIKENVGVVFSKGFTSLEEGRPELWEELRAAVGLKKKEEDGKRGGKGGGVDQEDLED